MDLKFVKHLLFQKEWNRQTYLQVKEDTLERKYSDIRLSMFVPRSKNCKNIHAQLEGKYSKHCSHNLMKVSHDMLDHQHK
jgi:hypothetical protein